MAAGRFREIFRIHPRGRDIPADVDAEIAFHMEERVARLVAVGLTPEEARAEAERRFGVSVDRGSLHELASRSERRRGRREWLSGLRHDVRAARSNLVRRPAFTLSIIAILAVGIATNVAVFGVADSALLSPLPFPAGDDLVLIQREYQSEADPGITATRFRALASGQRALADIAAVQTVGSRTLIANGVAVSASTTRVDERFFPLLAAPMIAGRGFSAAELRSQARVAVLSEDLWRSAFGADRGIVGRMVSIESVPHTVIGIAPARVSMLGSSAALWVPLPVDAADFGAIGRVRHGTPTDSLSGVLSAEAARVWGNPALSRSLLVRDAHEVLFGRTRPALILLAIATALVLAMVCANIVNLYLVRTIARAQEFSIRVSLGATRWRIVRQILVESGVLVAAASALALLIAQGLFGTIRAAADSRGTLPGITLDARMAVFAVLVGTVCWALLSLSASLRIAGRARGASFAIVGARSTAGAGAMHARRALVAFEIALSVMLVASAGLMLRTIDGMLRIDTGFDYHNAIAVDVVLPAVMEQDDGASRFYSALLERVRSLPGVTDAGATSTIPMGTRHSSTKFMLPADDDGAFALHAVVTDGYIEAMRIPLIQGRLYSADRSAGGVVVTRSFALKYFAGRSPLGAHIRVGSTSPRDRVITGIVADVRQESLIDDIGPMIYEPMYDGTNAPRTLVVRYQGDARRLMRAVTNEIAQLDSDVAISHAGTLEEAVRSTIADRRMLTRLLTSFGVIALALALLGVHAVVSHSVAARTREFAVRMAVGATRPDVLRLVMREESAALLLGIGAGVLGAFAFSRVLGQWVYGVSTRDPATYVIAVTLLGVTGLIATLVPARRAMRVEPQTVLNEGG